MSSPEKGFAPQDPMALVPAVMDVSMDEESYHQMAETFIEEYMLLGFSDEKIINLFRDPYFRATHQILESKGEPYVMELIREIRNG